MKEIFLTKFKIIPNVISATGFVHAFGVLLTLIPFFLAYSLSI